MPRREVGEQNIRSITKLGGSSYAITLPIGYIRDLKWRERQKVTVTKQGNKLIIEDWKK